MKHPARWIAGSVALVVVALGVVLALNVGNDPQAEMNSSRLLGRTAPAFDLATLDGGQVSSDDLSGRAVIVNFWNEWCPPCLAELPALKEFWAEHQGDGDVAMVGIVRDSAMSRAELAEYVSAEGLDWTIALDPRARAALDFSTRGQPETFAISPSGEIVGFQLSEVTVAGLEQMLAAARAAG